MGILGFQVPSVLCCLILGNTVLLCLFEVCGSLGIFVPSSEISVCTLCPRALMSGADPTNQPTNNPHSPKLQQLSKLWKWKQIPLPAISVLSLESFLSHILRTWFGITIFIPYEVKNFKNILLEVMTG